MLGEPYYTSDMETFKFLAWKHQNHILSISIGKKGLYIQWQEFQTNLCQASVSLVALREPELKEALAFIESFVEGSGHGRENSNKSIECQ